MPFSVVKAMLDSKTPEEFLDRILQAVKNNEWKHEAKLTLEDIGRLQAKEKDYETKLRAEKKEYENVELKKYDGIAFQSKELNRKGKPNFIYFEINRRYLRRPQEVENVEEKITAPRLNLFTRVFIPLAGDWNDAAKVFGMHSAEHPSEHLGTNTISQTLLIPASAIEQWHPFSKLKLDEKRSGGAGDAHSKIHVFIDNKKFEELNKYNRATETVFGYLKALDFLSGNISEHKLATTMRFDKRRGKALGAGPLEAFLIRNSKNYGAFFKEIAELTANKNLVEAKEAEASELKNAVERAVGKHLEIEECEFRKALSAQLISGLCHKGNQQSASMLVNEIRVLKHGEPPRFTPRRWR